MNNIRKINQKVENVFEVLDGMSYEEKQAVIDIAQRLLQVTSQFCPVIQE